MPATIPSHPWAPDQVSFSGWMEPRPFLDSISAGSRGRLCYRLRRYSCFPSVTLHYEWPRGLKWQDLLIVFTGCCCANFFLNIKTRSQMINVKIIFVHSLQKKSLTQPKTERICLRAALKLSDLHILSCWPQLQVFLTGFWQDLISVCPAVLFMTALMPNCP